MLKNLLFLILMCITIYGCSYSGPISAYGLPRKKIKELRYYDSSKNIDTLSVYKIIYSAAYNKDLNKYTHYLVDDYPYTSFLKFYPEGKLGLFVISDCDVDQMNRETFNPSKAKMGYYSFNNDILKTRISTIGDSYLYISNEIGSIQGDTIFLHNRANLHAAISVKQNINIEFLKNWKPDW